MIDKVNALAGVVAILIGLVSVFTGIRVITGTFNPGYITHLQLVWYNIILGFVSLFSGYLIFVKSKLAVKFSAVIMVLHSVTLISLLTVFNEVVAQQSINAMIFRVVIWVFIFFEVYIKINIHKTYI